MEPKKQTVVKEQGKVVVLSRGMSDEEKALAVQKEEAEEAREGSDRLPDDDFDEEYPR